MSENMKNTETRLTTVGARRLLKLAAFLRELPRQKFDFSHFTTVDGKPLLEALKAGTRRCGTTACAVGWMPAIWRKEMTWNTWDMPTSRDTGVEGFQLATRFFNISENDASTLFDPGYVGTPDYDATPKQVARHIERWVKAHYAGKATLRYGAAK